MFISPLVLDLEPRLPSFPTVSRVATRRIEPSSLPSPSELPDSDGVPVDNDLQYLVPTLLRLVLHHHRRQPDWFFGTNMGVYYNGTGFEPKIPIVPDAFISLGVKPPSNQKGRLSYIVWLENNIVPFWTLECVSQTYGNEYGEKMKTYARMGVTHYVIYNPHHYRRDQHAPLEVYRLVKGRYQRRTGDQIWFPELRLALGREAGTFQKWTREWLYWYDRTGKRLLLPEEENEQTQQQLVEERQQRVQTQQQLVQAQQRAERLAQLLRDQGIDLDNEQ
jgi:Uma2 family endonuclease